MDRIVGCHCLVGLNERLVNFLQVSRRATLDKISDPINTTTWEKKWLNVEDLNVPLIWKEEGLDYVESLQRGHIILFN